MYSDMCKYILCNQYANIVMYDTQGTLPAVSCVIVHIGYPIGYEAGWIGWCCACLAQSLLNQFFILCYVFSFIFICFFVVKVGCFQKGLFQICLGDRLIVVVALQTRKMQQKPPPPLNGKSHEKLPFFGNLFPRLVYPAGCHSWKNAQTVQTRLCNFSGLLCYFYASGHASTFFSFCCEVDIKDQWIDDL